MKRSDHLAFLVFWRFFPARSASNRQDAERARAKWTAGVLVAGLLATGCAGDPSEGYYRFRDALGAKDGGRLWNAVSAATRRKVAERMQQLGGLDESGRAKALAAAGVDAAAWKNLTREGLLLSLCLHAAASDLERLAQSRVVSSERSGSQARLKIVNGKESTVRVVHEEGKWRVDFPAP